MKCFFCNGEGDYETFIHEEDCPITKMRKMSMHLLIVTPYSYKIIPEDLYKVAVKE